jgi:hypothetical protein
MQLISKFEIDLLEIRNLLELLIDDGPLRRLLGLHFARISAISNRGQDDLAHSRRSD